MCSRRNWCTHTIYAAALGFIAVRSKRELHYRCILIHVFVQTCARVLANEDNEEEESSVGLFALSIIKREIYIGVFESRNILYYIYEYFIVISSMLCEI